MKLESLIKDLGSKDKERRWKASEELAEIGKKALNQLLEALKSNNVDLRVGAAITLGKIGVVEPLISALNDTEWEVRWAAATSLGNLRAKEAVDGLIALLKDEFWEVRRAAAIALGKIRDEKAAKPLAEALEAELMIRFEAARALIQLGSKAVGSLQALLNSEDPDVRMKAAEALGLIGDEKSSEALGELLKDPDAGVREAASKALARIGGRGIDELFSHLESEERSLEALKALDFADVDFEKILGILEEVLEKGNEDFRYEAVTILGKMGERGVELLVRALEDESELVRRGASMGLLMIGEKSLPYLKRVAEKNELARELIEKIEGKAQL
jgi:HEAT repeat protein